MKIFSLWGEVLLKGSERVHAQLAGVDAAGKRAGASMTRMGTTFSGVGSSVGRNSNRMIANMNAVGNQMAQTGKRWTNTGQKMTDAGASLTTGVTLPLAAIGYGSIKAAVDFETAFAGVRKTVDATEKQFGVLEMGIRQMAKEIPASTTEIARVAEAAGQLGIKQQDILKFTKTMVMMGTSTNMSSDQAATALARLANITQMPMDQIDRLGSTVVHLGNNLAATEEEIVNMGLRIAGAGHQVGMSEAQVLSFAGALSSVGINAEAGGTAISRVFVKMANDVEQGGKKLELFAQVAGVSAEDFRKKFQEDAAGAVVDFIEGLGKMKDSGENVFPVLKELGLSEVRVRDALLRASGAGDLFRKTIESGSKAWDKNTALTNEANERYKTTASQFQILKNKINDVGITLGDSLIPALIDAVDAAEPLIKALEKGAKWFSSLDPETRKWVVTVGALVVALGPVTYILGNVVRALGFLGRGIGSVVRYFTTFGKDAGGVGQALSRLGNILGSVGRFFLQVGRWVLMVGQWIFQVGRWIWAVIEVIAAAMGIAGATFAIIAAAIIAAIALIIIYWDEVKAFLIASWEYIKEMASSIWEGIKNAIVATWNYIKGLATSIWDGIKNAVVGAFKWMYDHNYYFQALVDFIVNAWNRAKSITTSVWNGIKSFLTSVWNGIKSTVTSVWNGIKSVITTVWNGIKSVTTSVWNSIKGFLSPLVNGIKKVITSAWNGIKSVTTSVWNKVKSTITGVAKSIQTTLSGLASKALSWGKNMMNMFLSGIKSKVAAVKNAVKGVAKDVASFLGFHSPTEEGPASDSDQWMPNMMDMLADGIRKNEGKLKKAVQHAAGQLSGFQDDVNIGALGFSPITGGAAGSAGSGATTITYGDINIHIHNADLRSDQRIDDVARRLGKRLDLQRRLPRPARQN